jgi:type IX secretion system PorP/SprF family membrane protein
VRKNRIVGFVVVSLLHVYASGQQDFHFSQWMQNTVALNPSAAGFSESEYRFTTNFRMQWLAMNGAALRTNTFSFDCKPVFSKDYKSNVGVGLNFSNDQTGDLRLTSNAISVPIAYNLALDENSHFSVGLSPGFISRSINDAYQTWDNQWNGLLFDQSISSGESERASTSSFDIGAGISYEYLADNQSFFQIGLSMQHITTPTVGYSPLAVNPYRQINAYGFGRILSYDKRYGFSPQVLVTIAGPNMNIIGGGSVDIALYQSTRRNFTEQTSFLSVGLLHRWRDALIGMVTFKFMDFKAGFSYDLCLSPLGYANKLSGAIELNLSYGLSTFSPRRR